MSDNPEIVVTARKPAGIKHVAGGGASAAVIALALAVTGLKPDEGKRNVTYLDIANLPTYCYGHMDRKAKVGTFHSDKECDALLTTDAKAKEQAVMRCTPQIADNPYMLAGATRLTFNIGEANYCTSGSARFFRASQFKLGCQAFAGWDGVIGKTPIKGAMSVRRLKDGRYFSEIRGLHDRRQREIAQCLQGVK